MRLAFLLPLLPLLAAPALAAGDGNDPWYGPYDAYIPTPPELISTREDTPPDTELVKRLFLLAYGERCNMAIGGGLGGMGPKVYDLAYREDYFDPSTPDRPVRLYQFNCDAGAYNVLSAFMIWDTFDGVRPLAFAAPSFDVEYETPDDDTKVRSISQSGFVANELLVNAWFDPESSAIFAHSFWRGLGDASNSGVWVHNRGRFELRSYEVDASYDGEVTPERLIDFGGPYFDPEQMPREEYDSEEEQEGAIK